MNSSSELPHGTLYKGEKIKPVPDYETSYAISNFGRVWAYPKINALGLKMSGKWLGADTHTRHKFAALYKDKERVRVLVSMLVAKAFVPNPNNKIAVKHLDGDLSNNHYSNLEWCDE